MSAIEFTAQAGKTFSVQLYNASTGATIGSAITGVTDSSVPTRYRADTGSNTGVVYAVATATNLRVAGYADLNNPTNGFSVLTDTPAVAPTGVTIEEIQAVNSDLLQSILNSGLVASSINPTIGDAIDRDLHSDWQITIPATTGPSDRILFSIGVRTDEPSLEADNQTGCLTGDRPEVVTVTRLSSSSVSVLIRAFALMTYLGYGSYEFELKTIQGSNTDLKYRADVSFRSGVSKEIA